MNKPIQPYATLEEAKKVNFINYNPPVDSSNIQDDINRIIAETIESVWRSAQSARDAEVRVIIESIPTECPDRESDEYDGGRSDFKSQLLVSLSGELKK